MMQERGEPLSSVSLSCQTYSLERARRAMRPALRPGHGTLERVPLGHPPSLHHLRGRFHDVVRRFLGTMGVSDFLRPSVPRRASLDFPGRSARPHTQTDVGPPGFRVRCCRTCVGSLTARGPGASRASDAASVAFRLRKQRRHPEVPAAEATGNRFRGPIPSLCVPLSNASPPPLRTTAHDSGPVWLATPSPYDTRSHDISPTLTGALSG